MWRGLGEMDGGWKQIQCGVLNIQLKGEEECPTRPFHLSLIMTHSYGEGGTLL